MKRNFINISLSLFGWDRVLVIFLFISFSFGQGYDITGRAFNELGKKLGPVRVVLYSQNKKKVIELETPSSGKFKLKNIPDGKYTMNLYGPDGYGITENLSISGANIDDLSPALNPNPDQTQIKIEAAGNGASLNWDPINSALEYVIYRDNNEIATVRETFYLDSLGPGQTYAYNIIAVKNDQSTGVRSITEYGKSLMSPPENIVSDVKKNIVKLSWNLVENATGYLIYRDGERINTTADNSYMDFKLKYDTEYSYTIATLDHDSDQGNQSVSVFAETHPEINAPKSLKAESGENQVTLTWKIEENAIKYYVYQNSYQKIYLKILLLQNSLWELL